MKNILLVCAAGMSTSMLVKRMQEHAAASGIAVNINALAISEAKEKIKNEISKIELFYNKGITKVIHLPEGTVELELNGL